MRQRVERRRGHAGSRVRARRRHRDLGAASRRCRRSVPASAADPAADRRRPPGRARRPERHVRRRRRIRGRRRGGRRRARRSARAAPGPDVVLMDLRMPEHGRRRPRSRELTARGVAAPGCWSSPPTTPTRDVLPAIEAGATGYLLKDAPRERAVPGRPRGRPRRVGALARRWRPGCSARCARRPRSRSASASSRCSSSSPAARPTARPRPRCSSARRPSRPTCCTSTRSSASTTARPRSPRRSSAACSCPAGRGPNHSGAVR